VKISGFTSTEAISTKLFLPDDMAVPPKDRSQRSEIGKPGVPNPMIQIF